MKPLFTDEEYKLAKSRDKLPCECSICEKKFYKIKYDLQKIIKKNNKHKPLFCSYECMRTREKVNCTNCSIEFEKIPTEIKKSKSGNHFCSKTCSTTYNNKNKTFGTRRSKLEIWLEQELKLIYPNMHIDFNKKDTIGSELDIFIPTLKTAFELNGILHYEPIYGLDKLNKIQENDMSKTKACSEANIDLFIIDTSTQKYVNAFTSKKYLNVITNIIDELLLNK
jgi:hypothetical protein